jgi:hypothetical protein
MVVIAPGRFEMGSPAGEQDRSDNEGPVRAVTMRCSARVAFSCAARAEACVRASATQAQCIATSAIAATVQRIERSTNAPELRSAPGETQAQRISPTDQLRQTNGWPSIWVDTTGPPSSLPGAAGRGARAA